MEYFMYAAIGFLAAWLMALMCFPAVHNRAQRLLRKHYDQAPLSIQEMRAEKDQIRAGFAAATRDLEVSIEKLKEKTAAHATDLAKKAQLIERLKKEIQTLNEALTQSTEREREARAELLEVSREFDQIHDTLASIAERERGVRADLRETRRELALKDNALDAAEQEVAAIKTEITRLAPLLQISVTQMNSMSPVVPQRPVERPLEVVTLAPPAAPVAPRQPALTQSNDDGVMQAWTEIDAAAKRVEQRYDGTPLKKPLSNQNLRAIYAPAMKPAN
jgi:septal ring factor EnvC (AmiA/AmiB activator)